MVKLHAVYFDGHSARARPVQLQALAGEVWAQGEGIERRAPLAEVQISEQLGRAPRMIRFRDGAHLEVSDHEAFAIWLEAAGYRERQVDLAQRSWGIALVSIVLVLATGFASYRWGLPLAAQFIAARVPPAVTAELSRGTLALMDRHLLKPSQLEADHQAALKAGFRKLDPAGLATLLFRASPEIGANAMALPDGSILLLDELVDLAADDEEILAVLAHELAHVEQHHGLRLMIQGAAAGAFVAWWIGDYSPLVTAAPVAILHARHSRELEAEADAEAARRLRGVGIAPARLADMLERLAAAHGMRVEELAGREGKPEEGPLLGYLSSHPATRERIRALRQS